MNEQWQMNKLISWKFYSKIHTLILKSNSRNTLVSSRLSRKRNLSILLNFLFPFVFFRRIFNLEVQKFSLENHHMMNERQPFCWWMTFTKVSNVPLPPPPMWLTMWLLWGRGGMGENFFLKSLELEIFPLTYDSVRFIFQHYIYVMSDFLFQCRILFFPVISLQAFSPRSQSAGYFF